MNRGLLLAIVAIIGFSLYQHSHASPESDPTKSWLQGQIDALKLKVQKIEALVTLMKDEKPVVSEPLRDYHLLPVKQISQVTQPEQAPYVDPKVITPGMEPTKEPVQSQPVAKGHYETQRYGFRGRYTRQVWVPEGQQTYQYNYSSGGCSSGSCGRGGIF